MLTIPRLSDHGYRILDELARANPVLFTKSATDELQQRLEADAKKGGEFPYQAKQLELEVALNPLNDIEQPGPDSDAHYAPLIRQAVGGITPAQAADDLLWASINCFAVSPYISVRWKTSNLRNSNPSKYVRDHWLWNSRPRISNASARLWWLAERANRASEYSIHSPETLLESMADNVGLYHQLSDRVYFAASPVLVAAIYDVVLAGNEYVYRRPMANQLLRTLNIKAGNMSFDILDYDELYEIVESSLPPLGAGAAG